MRATLLSAALGVLALGDAACATVSTQGAPCEEAQRIRGRYTDALSRGRLDRARRLILRARALCRACEAETRPVLVETLVGLGRFEEADPLCKRLDAQHSAEARLREACTTLEHERRKGLVPDPVGFYESAVRTRARGDVAGAQRLFDRALSDLERAAAQGAMGPAEPVHLDVPNGVVGRIDAIALAGEPARMIAISSSPDHVHSTLSLYDARTMQSRWRLAAENPIRVIAVSPDGSLVGMLRSKDGGPDSLEIRNGSNGALRFTIPFLGSTGPFGKSVVLAFSADGSVLRARWAGSGGEWSTIDGRPSSTVVPPLRPDPSSAQPGVEWAQCSISAVASAGTDRIVAAGCEDGRVFLSEGGHVVQAIAPHSAEVLSVVIDPKTDRWLSGHGDGAARTWDPRTGRVLARFETGSAGATGFSPDGGVVIGGCGAPGAASRGGGAADGPHVCVWTRDGRRLAALGDSEISPVTSTPAWRFNRDGRLLAMLSKSSLQLWDVRTPRLIEVLEPWSCDRDGSWCGVATDVEFGPDDSVWALTGGNLEHWTSLGSPIRRPPAPDAAFGFAVSPDGERLVVGGPTGLEWYEGGSRIAARSAPAGNPLSFSPSGGRLLVEEGHAVAVLDVRSRARIAELTGTESVNAVAFSRDGGEALMAYQSARSERPIARPFPSGGLALWSATTGRAIATIRAVDGTDDSYVMTEGPDARIELFGDAGREHVFCRAGALTLPFDACAERFEVTGLLEKQRKGDLSYLDP
jgi:WD40 repeat protein